MLFKGRKEQAGSEASSPNFFWWAQHLYLFARAGPHYWTSSTGPQNSDVWYAKSFYILRFHSCLSVSVVWHENWSHQIIDSSISTQEQDTLKIKIAAGQPLVISQSTYLGIFSPLYSAASDKLSYNPKTHIALQYTITLYTPFSNTPQGAETMYKDSWYFVLAQSGLAFGGRGWVKMAQKADIQPRI